MEGILKKYKNFVSGYLNCFLKIVTQTDQQQQTDDGNQARAPYLKIEKSYYNDRQKNKFIFIELNAGTVLEPSGKDDLIIAQAADTKKLYFKALDTMERDQWLKALIDERAKAPVMYVQENTGKKKKRKGRKPDIANNFKDEMFDQFHSKVMLDE